MGWVTDIVSRQVQNPKNINRSNMYGIPCAKFMINYCDMVQALRLEKFSDHFKLLDRQI